MPHSGWFWLLWLMVVGFPWLLARKGRGRDLVALSRYSRTCSMHAFTCCWFHQATGSQRRSPRSVAGCQPGCIVCFPIPRAPTREAGSTAAGPDLDDCSRVRASFHSGLIEVTCRLLTELRVLKYRQGIQTVWRSGHDDWRLATITGDQHREPDPVLLWRPAAHKPFNSQRLQGSSGGKPQAAGRRPHHVLWRFSDRRPTQGGMAELVPNPAGRTTAHPRPSIRSHQCRRRGLHFAPGLVAFPSGSR